MDSINAVSPAYKTIIDIISEVIYSIRPWPYGCCLSGARDANFVPAIVMILDKASLKLFIASITIAIELASTPTNALNNANTIFDIILIILVLKTIFSLFFFFFSYYFFY